jgi:flagellar protein FlbD
MIKATRLDKTEIYLNPHEIEFMEQTPDTIVTMTTGRKIIVREKVDELVDRIVAYRARIAATAARPQTRAENE